MDRDDFVKNYMGKFPDDFLSWVDIFADEVRRFPHPEPGNDAYKYWKALGEWEIRQKIYAELRVAVNKEKERIDEEEKNAIKRIFCEERK